MDQTTNKEFPYNGKILNGFGMLAVVLLLFPAIIAVSFVVLPEPLWWISGIITGTLYQ